MRAHVHRLKPDTNFPLSQPPTTAKLSFVGVVSSKTTILWVCWHLVGRTFPANFSSQTLMNDSACVLCLSFNTAVWTSPRSGRSSGDYRAIFLALVNSGIPFTHFRSIRPTSTSVACRGAMSFYAEVYEVSFDVTVCYQPHSSPYDLVEWVWYQTLGHR